MTHVIGLDPGSKWCGLTTIEGTIERASIRAETVEVDPLDVTGAVVAIEREIVRALAAGPVTLAIEWINRDKPYMPRGVTPHGAAEIAGAFVTMTRIVDRVSVLARALGVAVVTIPRNTWCSRVGAFGEPRPNGGKARVNDVAIRAALERLLGVEVIATIVGDVAARWSSGWRANETHVLDGLGVALGFLLAPVRVPGDKTDGQLEAHRLSAKASKRRRLDRERREAGLPPRVYAEGPGRRAKLVTLDGVTATQAEHAERIQRALCTVSARMLRGATRDTVGAPAGTVQKCRACGQPRRGHACPNKTPPSPL